MYIAPGRGRQPIGDKNFLTMLQVSKWSLRNLILYTFLMILYTYIALGQGQKAPWGQTFDVNRKSLSFRRFVASFKQISLNSDFIHIFFHMYIGTEADNDLWTKFWYQQKGLVTWPICCKFQKHIFEVRFIQIFACFIHVYSPGAGADNPLGSAFLF